LSDLVNKTVRKCKHGHVELLNINHFKQKTLRSCETQKEQSQKP